MEFNDVQEFIQTYKFRVKIKFEKSEETFSCNKEIVWWRWTKVDYSIRWVSVPHRKFCYPLSPMSRIISVRKVYRLIFVTSI